jgi:hypothetical protein
MFLSPAELQSCILAQYQGSAQGEFNWTRLNDCWVSDVCVLMLVHCYYIITILKANEQQNTYCHAHVVSTDGGLDC